MLMSRVWHCTPETVTVDLAFFEFFLLERDLE